jgi:hypothetical protein
MTIKSLGNTLATFKDIFGKTGNRASAEYIPPSFSATGGNVDALAPGNGYKYHTFTSPGTFTVSGAPGTVEVLIVAGGGSGGGRAGGGGGAGGIAYATSHSISAPSSIPIVVGSGGPISTPSVNIGNTGVPGNDSTFGSSPNPYYIISKGGGGGGGETGPTAPVAGGLPGGSGGGQMYGPPTWASDIAPGTQPTQNPGKPNITNYGNSGGNGVGQPLFKSGGGGGAGAVGTNGSPGATGPGGIGVQFPNFTGPLIGVPSLAPLSGYFGGGGGGGQHPPQGTPSSGGLGGGGAGGSGPGVPGSAAVTNSGGGGGGANTDGAPSQVFSGGTGGPGIVIIRYLA